MLLINYYSTRVLNLNLHSYYSLPDLLLFLFGQNPVNQTLDGSRTNSDSATLCPALFCLSPVPCLPAPEFSIKTC